MRINKSGLPLRAGIACLLGILAGSARAQTGGIPWLDNYADALKEARRTQKPIFLEFRCEP